MFGRKPPWRGGNEDERRLVPTERNLPAKRQEDMPLIDDRKAFLKAQIARIIKDRPGDAARILQGWLKDDKE